MTKKTFLWNFEKQNFYITKIINEEVYSKSYIRAKVNDSKNYFVVDNNSKINHLYFPKKKKYISWFKKQLLLKQKNKKEKNDKIKVKKIVGKSLNLNTMVLRHKFWKHIRISLPIIVNPNRKSNLLRIQKLYKQIEKKNIKNIYINKSNKKIKKGIFTRFFGINPLLSKKEYEIANKYNKYAIYKEVQSKKDKSKFEIVDRTKIIPLELFKIKNFNFKIKAADYARVYSKRPKWFKRKKYIVKNQRKNIFNRQYFIFDQKNIVAKNIVKKN